MTKVDCKARRASVQDRKNVFIKRSLDAHKGFYTYDKVVYVRASEKVIITCPEHGDFEQLPINHVRGNGCAKCRSKLMGDLLRKSTKQFVLEATEKHNNFYSYKKTKYKTKSDKVVITCPVHGDFKQSASNHLMGRGCHSCGDAMQWDCSINGFKKLCDKNNSGKGLLYILQCSKGSEVFFKIGITSVGVKSRYYSKGAMPYNYTVSFLIEGSPYYIFSLEAQLHRILRKKEKRYTPKIPFGGYTECFTTIKPIERLLKRLTSTEQLQLIA